MAKVAVKIKPSKPSDTFPLFPHPNGQWCKVIRGKQHYFGAWADPQAAYIRFKDEEDDLRAGRVPARGDDLTLRELVNHFLTFKQGQVDTGELAQGTFDDYHENCERVIAAFGRTRSVKNIQPLDFEKLRAEFAKTHGPETLKGDIACTRALFNYCDDTFAIRVRWGKNFKKPSRAVLRRNRKARESRMYEPAELRKIIKAAEPQLRAMIYLGLNCGFGNRDCAYLVPAVIDFNGKWIDYERNKTGISRRCPLWPETVTTIRAALKARPKPSTDCENVFITKYGNLWANESEDDPISKGTTKLLTKLELKRHGVSFNAFRHIFYTIGKRLDKDATKVIMGHAEESDDMGVHYDEDGLPVDDKRLQAVTAHVRKWLNSKATAKSIR